MVRAYTLAGRTSQGTPVGRGTIAVDPRLIPFGSRIYVPGYGWGRALDRGNSVQGAAIDIWMATAAECRAWGVRRLEIRIVPPTTTP
ncbi:MAG: 3D domain-containing protein [Candidatus Xenobia bacterium]